MITNQIIKIIPAVRLSDERRMAIKIPLAVAPNIGINDKVKAIATVGKAKSAGISLKKRLIVKTLIPAIVPPIVETISCPVT